ncbi:MAG: TRAP transporter large permease [Acidaminococcales bacterium]|jgi:C4-dicarboxylate transporter DctM subunit|nr:TRAP transporter large permease [Acidaminococcales bacterium]
MILTVIALFLFFLITGLPVAFSAALTSAVCFYLFDFSSLTTVSHIMYSSLNNFSLVALPLFIIVGVIMSKGLLVKYMFEFANSVFKNLRGGLGIAAIITSAVFAAISGSSLANAAALGMILLPYMVKYGYDKGFTCGILATGGTLGILIPPSLTMIVYGTITEQSIGQCFMAGMLPGIFATAVLSVFTFFWAGPKRVSRPVKEKLSLKEIITCFKESFLILLAPIIIIGGIYGGVFTADESAAVGVAYCLVITIFYYKTIKIKDLPEIFAEGAVSSSQIMVVFSGVMVFAYIITISQVSNEIIEWIVNIGLSPLAFMLAVNLLLLFLGCLLDVISIMLITIPIIYPVLLQLGFHPLHIAVIYTINMEIGTITPPIGMNLFALSGSTGTPVAEVARGTLPYVVVMLIILGVIIMAPELSIWLPLRI